MRHRDQRDYLKDILDSIDDIQSFTENLTFESFRQDRKTVHAIVRCIEVIGEASGKVSKSLRDKHPEVPWKKMVGMRNKMIHEYFGIDIAPSFGKGKGTDTRIQAKLDL